MIVGPTTKIMQARNALPSSNMFRPTGKTSFLLSRRYDLETCSLVGSRKTVGMAMLYPKMQPFLRRLRARECGSQAACLNARYLCLDLALKGLDTILGAFATLETFD